MSGMAEAVRALPKAELHLHIEGTLEPEMLLALAARNGVDTPYDSPEAARAAYAFDDLQGFLDLYYLGMSVLKTEDDFADLARAYVLRVALDGVRHAEVFFDPQGHTTRGIGFDTALNGIWRGLAEGAAATGMSFKLIACFLRDRPVAEAETTLDAIVANADRIVGVGLDSAERNHPPALFRSVFERAAAAGLKRVAHAGEEGPAANVRSAIEDLGVDRIDHGYAALDDPAVLALAAERGLSFTFCPLSNLALKVVPRLAEHPLPRFLVAGASVSINSDDPAYFFGRYVLDNYLAAHDQMGLTFEDLRACARTSFTSSFLAAEDIARHVAAVDAAPAPSG